jgi:acetyltransferase-like isoleucine patch superfamily enzyme
MPVEVIDRGSDNKLDLPPWFTKYGRLKVEFLGNGASLSVAGIPLSCTNAVVQLGAGSSVTVGQSCGLSNTFIFAKSNGHVTIGSHSTFTTRARFIMHEPSRIDIGTDCMIASDVQFMTSDVHTVYDRETGKRLNRPKDIVVGDHVWIALQTFVLKGARIGSGSVIGLRSVVTGEIPENSLAVGSPARVLREGVGWDRKLWAEDQEARIATPV